MLWTVVATALAVWLLYIYATFPRYPPLMSVKEKVAFYITEVVTVPTFWKLFLDKMGLIRFPLLSRYLASSPPIRFLVPVGRTERRLLAGVPVYIFRPPAGKDRKAGGRGIIYFHGGGWYLGSVHSHGACVEKIADKANAVVVFVDYRLAPENLYPAAFDDCYNVTEAVLQQSEELGINPQKISLGGDSSGGGLAAAVSLKRKAEKLQPLCCQFLVYPILQAFYFNLDSYRSRSPLLLTKDMVAMAVSLYVTGDCQLITPLLQNQVLSRSMAKEVLNRRWGLNVSDEELLEYREESPQFESALMDPYLCPLAAESLKGLPPSLVISSDLDILQSDALVFGKRMKEDGVEVEERVMNAPHSFMNYVGPYIGLPAADKGIDIISAFLMEKC